MITYEIATKHRDGFDLATPDEFRGAMRQETGIVFNKRSFGPPHRKTPRKKYIDRFKSFVKKIDAKRILDLDVWLIAHQSGSVLFDLTGKWMRISYRNERNEAWATPLYVRATGEAARPELNLPPDLIDSMLQQIKDPLLREKFLDDLKTAGVELGGEEKTVLESGFRMEVEVDFGMIRELTETLTEEETHLLYEALSVGMPHLA